MLHGVVLVEHVSVESANHVRADRANHTVDDVAILAFRDAPPIRLRPSSIGVVVTAHNVNVRVGPLPAGVMPNQVEVAKPKPAQPANAQAFSRVS